MRSVRVAAAAVLLACASAVGSAPAGAATKSAKADASAVLAVGADITTKSGGANFDPALQSARVTDQAAAYYMPSVFDAVVRVDENGNTQPGLATKWDTSDPTIALFTFRKGVKFQDGTAFTTAAVKEAWDRIRVTPASSAVHEISWDAITAVDLVGDAQVKVTFSDESANRFVSQVATTGQADVPSPTAYAKDPEGFKFNPVGAGPYKLESFQSGQKIELRRWKGYWDSASQKLGGIDISQTDTGAPMVASLQAGQINLGQVSVADAAGLKGNPDIEVESFTNTPNTFVLLPCTNKAPFDNADARLALSYAVDRKALNQAAYAGQGAPTDVQFGKGSPYYQTQLDNTHPQNLKKAKALLKKAGVAPGTAVNVMLSSTFATEGGDRASVVLQDQLKAVGLDAKLTTAASFVTDQLRLNPELILLASDETIPNNFLKTNSPVNWCKYSNAPLDAALVQSNTAAAGTPEARTAWKAIQTIINKESPVIYAVRAPILYAHTTNVEGFEITPAKRQPLIWNLSMTSS